MYREIGNVIAKHVEAQVWFICSLAEHANKKD
jgi:hypothetical protein